MSKVSKKRQCPAIGREISSAECGQNRVSKYACPVTCPFNPFSPTGYDEFTKIEKEVIQRHFEWYLSTSPNRNQALRDVEQHSRSDPSSAAAFQVYEMFFKRLPGEQTRFERWTSDGFPGMKNDHVIIQKAMGGIRLRLLEIRQIIDDLRVEAVDLLEENPQPILICDRAMAAHMCRFTTVLAWTFALPWFHRVYGNGIAVPTLSPFEPLFVVREIARHVGCPEDRNWWNEWFGLNGIRFLTALTATSLHRRSLMFDRLNAEFTKVIYELRAPFAECRALLDAQPDIDEDALAPTESDEGFAAARIWISAEEHGTETSEKSIGRVLLGQTHWRLEALGSDQIARLRKLFEEALGDRVRFIAERRDDLAAVMKSKQPAYDETLVPPNLKESPQQIQLSFQRVDLHGRSKEEVLDDFNLEMNQAWLEEAIPALDNRTPRDAAADPELRPKLVALLKERIKGADELALRHGIAPRDFSSMLGELGINELNSDPPPLRTSMAQPSADDIKGELRPWPSLPPRPFTAAEAVKRLNAAFFFEDPDDAIEAMETAGGYLADDLVEIAGNLLTSESRNILEALAIRLWFVFVPLGHFGPDISFEELYDECAKHLAGMLEFSKKHPSSDATIKYLLDNDSQPELIRVLANMVLSSRNSRTKKGADPESENPILILLFLKAAVELLDSKCRKN